jgi:hypothetical protein
MLSIHSSTVLTESLSVAIQVTDVISETDDKGSGCVMETVGGFVSVSCSSSQAQNNKQIHKNGIELYFFTL